ncbi:MAG: hypothetical protein SPL08_04080 [Pseudomonadota bacterium]|nr:hypothetical protein [Pseudomonadota bacterium]
MYINNQESGRSMVEMMGVLAIIGVLSIGAISTANFGLESFRVSSAFTLIENTAMGVSDLYSWKREFPDHNSNDMRNKICNNKVFDDPCESDEDVATVTTPWGSLRVEADSSAQFKITLTDVPYRACSQLLTMKWTNVTLNTSACTDTGEAKTDMLFYGS